MNHTIEAIILTGKIAGTVTAIFGVLYAMVKVFKTIYGAARKIEQSFGLLTEQKEKLIVFEESLIDLDDQLLALDAQFKTHFMPNGGGSFADSLSRIEDRMSLLQQEKRISMIAGGIAEFISDTHGQCTEVNRVYCELLGVQPSEVMGAGWTNFVHSDDRDAVYASWLSAVSKGTEWHMPSYRFVRKNDEELECSGSAYPLRYKGREIHGYVGFIRVISGGVQ